MERKTKIVRQINRTKGTLTDKSGKTVPVHFNLIQTQAVIDGLPTLRSARGALEFGSSADAELMFSTPERKMLRGGGIEAEVNVNSRESFKVTGPVRDIK